MVVAQQEAAAAITKTELNKLRHDLHRGVLSQAEFNMITAPDMPVQRLGIKEVTL